MCIKTTVTFFVLESQHVKIPSYKNRVWIILSKINQVTQESSFMLLLGYTIHGN